MKKDKNFHTIYGLNNCVNLLESVALYNIQKIYLQLHGKATKEDSLCKKLEQYSDKLIYLDKNKFFNKYPYKHTQGIVINFSGKIEKDLIPYNDENTNQCYIIIDQINDPQNLGQIIRTSECAGIEGIILPRHSSVHITDTVLQVSQGAFLHTNIYIANNIAQLISEMKKKDFWVIGIENSIEAKQWHKIDYKGKIIIIFGSEGKGIRPLVKKSCDFLATIPMNGKINSLNVTAALSAILFERQRQIISNEKDKSV